MSNSKCKFEREEFCIFDDTPEFERKKLMHNNASPSAPTKSIDICRLKGNKLEQSYKEGNIEDDFRKSTPISLYSNAKIKELSTEALCQSIELLKMEITDVKEREKTQENMYK